MPAQSARAVSGSSGAGTVVLRLPGVLRTYAEGSATLTLAAGDVGTVGQLLDRVDADHPALGRRLRDERGVVRRHVNVFVDGHDIRRGDGLQTTVQAGSEVLVIPAVSGG